MPCIKSFAPVVLAAELLAKGVDFTKESIDNFKKNADGTKFNLKIDEDTQKFFQLATPYIYREDRIVYSLKKIEEDYNPDLTITFDKIKSIMQVLWENNIELFSEFKEEDFIPDFKKKMKELDKEFDRNLKMKQELSRENTDEALKIFLALFNYKQGYSKKLYEYNKTDADFKLDKAKDFEILDNRLYIYITPSISNQIRKLLKANNATYPKEYEDIKAFVISKNVYDYFWASYGNEWQSCFALNSEYNYLYGYIPFALTPQSFMCYATTGGTNKIPIISGNQFKCPNMKFRMWGYADENGKLLFDKRYLQHTDDRDVFIKYFLQVICKLIGGHDDKEYSTKRVLYNNGKDIAQILEELNTKFYADSLRCFDDNEGIYFQYAQGSSTVGHNSCPWQASYRRFIDYAGTVSQVSPTLTLDKPVSVINGVLLNPKRCPVTGLIISETENKSPFAKYFTKSCVNSMVITYLGGQVFLDDSTVKDTFASDHFKVSYDILNYNRGFVGGKLHIMPYKSVPFSDSRDITLKTLKEMLKGFIDELCVDGILLRYFEGSEVKYQFFKNGK